VPVPHEKRYAITLSKLQSWIPIIFLIRISRERNSPLIILRIDYLIAARNSLPVTRYQRRNNARFRYQRMHRTRDFIIRTREHQIYRSESIDSFSMQTYKIVQSATLKSCKNHFQLYLLKSPMSILHDSWYKMREICSLRNDFTGTRFSSEVTHVFRCKFLPDWSRAIFRFIADRHRLSAIVVFFPSNDERSRVSQLDPLSSPSRFR